MPQQPVRLQGETLEKIFSALEDQEMDTQHTRNMLIDVLRKDPAFANASDKDLKEFITLLIMKSLNSAEMNGEQE